MPEVLEDAGVSWKVYNPAGSVYAPAFFEQHGLLIGDAILPFFSQYKSPASALYQKAFLPQYPADFVSDVAHGTLPAVSWILPPAGYDEHPPSPPALGEWFTSQLLKTLTANPKVWSKTVLFHMYDENDGFFDHVPPPAPPPGTAGEYVSGSPLPSDAEGIAGPIGLGFRVPMMVISPFSRGGHVASQVFDHTSQLRFLEERFGVRAPNISAWRRRHTGDLTSTLRMGKANLSLPALPSTSHDQTADVLAEGCTQAEILGGPGTFARYPVPVHQTMPRQETGLSLEVPRVCCPDVVRPRVRTALWGGGRSGQNRCRRDPAHRRGAGWDFGPARPAHTMDKEPTAQHWLFKATNVLARVTGAELRFSASMSVNDVTMLAAADELEVATREAMVWTAANACPDLEVGGRVLLMLRTCAEVALTAQWAITDPDVETSEVVGRLGDLLAIIDFHWQTLDAW